MATTGSAEEQRKTLRERAALYPHPVAAALSRLSRAQTDVERVDGALKAAEVLTRYLMAISVSSFAARQGAETDGEKLAPLAGHLAFGEFLRVLQQIAKLEVDHPIRPHLAPFRAKGKGPAKEPPVADQALIDLVNLRNKLGHDLTGLSGARAALILRDVRPVDRLLEACDSLKALLGLPLLEIEGQQTEDLRVQAVRVWLMGDTPDPAGEVIDVEGLGFRKRQVPYLAVDQRVLRLDPILVWGLVTERTAYGLFVIDGIHGTKLTYQPVDAAIVGHDEAVAQMSDLFSGKPRPAEVVRVSDGRDLAAIWRERKCALEESHRVLAGAMPWDEFDSKTLEWYAGRLTDTKGGSARSVISERLFDNRQTFSPDDLRQARLLFGTDTVVRRLLARELLDLRAIGDGSERWKERTLVTENVLQSLGKAVEFLARHLKLDAAVDKLSTASGTADYVATREALINLFMHQDYTDKSAAAQVELQAERAVFFNAGCSMVSPDALIEGGKSQSRNALIARALCLIGFAERAGSGIRALQSAWRAASRRPPRFESDRQANSFTLTLDWRTIEDAYDAHWKARIGASVSANQAKLLNVALDPMGLTVAMAASATGLTVDEAGEQLRHLVRQVLLQEREGRYHLADHLRELVD